MDALSTVTNILDPAVYGNFKKEEEFADLATRVAKLGLLNIANPNKLVEIIDQFNSAWTTLLLTQRKIAYIKGAKVHSVEFSSVHQKVTWLSNFYLTLIFDPTSQRCMTALEHHYVLFKISKSGKIDSGNNDTAEDLSEMSPKEAKVYGSEYQRPGDRESLGEMERLTRLKYGQNSVLSDMLKRTHPADLNEATSDGFWGTAHGTGGTNHLGKIIVAVRDSLLS